MKEKIRQMPKSIVLYVIFGILMIVVVSLKSDYYIDEIYSYGLSNGVNDGIDMEITYDQKYEPAESVYWDYMQVQNGERFYYKNVWKNQKNDVHPPLYYSVLHTICSVFPNTFSKWYAGGVNIVCALLVLFVLRRLLTELTENGYVREIMSVAFILLTGVLHAAANFRMYMMAMMIVTFLTYLFVRQIGKKQEISFYLCICFTAVCGALTHYYVTLYIVFLSFAYGICLLWQKKGKETGLFVLSMACAAGISLALFPAMIEHMFFGYRGAEAVDNLKENADYWENLKSFFAILDQQMFGKTLGGLLAVFALIFIVRCAWRYFQVSGELGTENMVFGFDRNAIMRYGLIFLPCFFYYMVVSKITFAVADRYISPIYAVLFAGLLCMAYTLLSFFLKGKTFLIASVLLTALMVSESYKDFSWTYLFLDSGQKLAKVKEYKDYDCVCVYDGSETYVLYPEFAEYSYYKSIVFVTVQELEEQGIGQWVESDGIVVSFFLVEEDAKKQIKKLKKETGFQTAKKLGTFGFDNTYFLY